MKTQQKSDVLKWSLIIGIVIVLNMFFNYALSVAYHSPEYTDFCKNTQVIDAISTQTQCLAVGGQWNANTYNTPVTPTPADGVLLKQNMPAGSCDPNYTCQNDYATAQSTYDRNVFITLVVLGVLTLGISTFIGNAAVSQGLSLGGVLSFVIASMRYWGSADDLVKVFILAVALATLIYIAYKKFGNSLSE